MHPHQNLRVKSELGKKVEGSKISEVISLLPNMGKDGVELTQRFGPSRIL